MQIMVTNIQPAVPGKELTRLVGETRKMLARVARKCKSQGIEGYDGTDAWLNDLDDVVRASDGWIRHQDVVTLVEAIQYRRWNQFPESSFVIWEGTDLMQCTMLLDYLNAQGIKAVQRLSRKRAGLIPYALTVEVTEPEFNAAQAAKVSWLEGSTP